jgi:chaperonin GroEL (HSP60 family)
LKEENYTLSTPYPHVELEVEDALVVVKVCQSSKVIARGGGQTFGSGS